MKQRKAVWVKPEIRQAFEAIIITTIEKARTFCNIELTIPTVEFHRLGRPAGKCRYNRATQTAIVLINVDYFEQDYNYVLNQTCPHEVAHYVTDRMFPNCQAHGVEWQNTMRKLGLKVARCHKMDSSKTKLRNVARPFKYTCGCPNKEFLLTFHKHNQHQTRKYQCRKCKSTIVYQGMFKGEQFVSKVQRTKSAVVTKEIEILPVVVVKPKPVEIPATHKTVTKFIGGSLVNVRIPIAA